MYDLTWKDLKTWKNNQSSVKTGRAPINKKTFIAFLEREGYTVTQKEVRIDNPKKVGRIYVSPPKPRYALEFSVKNDCISFDFNANFPFSWQLYSFLDRVISTDRSWDIGW